jgi:hypothetical protein
MKNLINLIFFFFALATLLPSCLDEDFDQPPTGGVDPGLTANLTILDLKKKHALGGFETIDSNWIIKGTIVADDRSGNWYKAFVIQDSTAGIEIMLDLAESWVFYPVGREVYVKLKGLVMGDYNNLIQLGGYISNDGSGPELGPIVDATGHLVKGLKSKGVAAKVRTIGELTTKSVQQLILEDVSTLIQIQDVQFNKGVICDTYADAVNQESVNRQLDDCNGNSIIVRSSGFATFAGENIADGKGTFTGIFSLYRNDEQLLFRDLNDIAMDGVRCEGEVNELDEDFSAGGNSQDIAFNGWANTAVKGSRVWRTQVFSGNTYAQATAYNDASAEMETWLITPNIRLDKPKVLTFETAKAFYTHDGLSVWITSNICDEWFPLDAILAGESDADHAFIPSGEIDLSSYSGVVNIGFRYVGSGPNGQTGSFRVDNIVVKDK